MMKRRAVQVMGNLGGSNPEDSGGGKMKGTVEGRPKKPKLLSMKYWLVNRDPYNGLL